MNTQTYMSQEVKLVFSEAAQKAIEIGRRYHYRFRVVGSGEVPEKPFYQGAWYFEPVLEPPVGKNILDLLKRSGVAYKGIVMAHEVSLVEAPAVKENEKTDFKIALPSIPATDIVEIVAKIAMGMAMVAAFIFLAILRDPAVIIVLEDDTWLETCNYYHE